jgi:hypothetical protein
MARTTNQYNGVNYDSPDELEFAKYLDKLGIKFTPHKYFKLLDSTEYSKEYGWIIDFYLDDFDIAIDVKGDINAMNDAMWQRRIFERTYLKIPVLYVFRTKTAWFKNVFGTEFADDKQYRKIHKTFKKFKIDKGLKQMRVKDVTEEFKEDMLNECSGFLQGVIK